MSVQDSFISLVKLSLYIEKLNKRFFHNSGISLFQWYILKHLIDLPATSAQDLAEAINTHPSSLTQSLKTLFAKQWIVIDKDPRDSRRKIISITRSGKEIVEKIELEMESSCREISFFKGQLDILLGKIESI